MGELSEWAVGDPAVAFFSAFMFCLSWALLVILTFVWKGKGQPVLFKIMATPPVLALMAAIFYAAANAFSKFLGFYVWPLPLL